jgi:drug/metabolite transporter (DMT)-like permease
MSPPDLARLLALAALWGGSFAFIRVAANIGPARALSVTFLIPLFGVFWGYLFLGEPLTINMLLGGSLILGGTWLAMRVTVASGGVRPRIASVSKGDSS